MCQKIIEIPGEKWSTIWLCNKFGFLTLSWSEISILPNIAGFFWLTPSGMSRKGSLLGNLLDKSIFAKLSFLPAGQRKSVWVSWSPARWCCAVLWAGGVVTKVANHLMTRSQQKTATKSNKLSTSSQ